MRQRRRPNRSTGLQIHGSDRLTGLRREEGGGASLERGDIGYLYIGYLYRYPIDIYIRSPLLLCRPTEAFKATYFVDNGDDNDENGDNDEDNCSG